MTNDLELTKNQIIFHSKDEEVNLEVVLKGESIWLSLMQISELFQRDKSVISRHISNIWKASELDKKETVAFFATVRKEGSKSVKRDIEYYNLDMILSVGYRVNSKRGTEFRRWATQVLNQHLLKGYTLNQQRLSEKSLKEITSALNLLQRSLKESGEITDIGESALEIIQKFAKAWHLLLAYDENKLENPDDLEIPPLLDEGEAEEAIASLAKELKEKGEASDLFSKPRNHGIKEILGNIHQTFGQKMLYPSVKERAAHLFYFVIKDHPFVDGNKRTASFLFLLYLKQHGIDTASITNEVLATLALLIAQSQPSDKEILIKLILNLI